MISVNKPAFLGNEKKYLLDCINTGWISSDGNYVKKFEKKFSKFVDRKFSTTVSNGSVALEIALRALKLKKVQKLFCQLLQLFLVVMPL
jgi:perosamine synthetase